MNKNNVLSRNKILFHKDRLQEWLKTGLGKPITAEIDPTNQCNYHCLGCAGGRFPERATFSESDLKHIIDKLSSTIKGILFTGGGEPLFNKATPNAIVYAKSKGIDVGLITTGFFLNEKYRSGITEKILNNCQWLRISLDATDKQTYANRKVVPPINFDFVLDNIKNLVSKKKELNSKCTIGIAYLTRNESYEELEKFVLLAKSLDADYAQFRPYHDVNNDISEQIEKTKIYESDEFSVYYPKDKYQKKKHNYDVCYGDEFRIVVSATGDLYPDCFTRGRDNFAYGNILTQSFEEIWNSEKRKKIFANKLNQPNCPDMSKYDTLNAILWNLYQNKESYDLNKLSKQVANTKHINFI